MTDLERVGPRLPAVARRAIAEWLGGGGHGAFQPDGPRAPVFVTLRTRDGSLRGCIGSVVASEPDVVSETVRSAVLAATRDPRFEPVSASELDSLLIEVSALGPEEPVQGVAELDPRSFGVVVRGPGGRQGLLLPDIPGVDDAAAQVDIARRKARIPSGVEVVLSRFRVQKWEEAK